MKNSKLSKSWSETSVSNVWASSVTGWFSWTISRTSCLIMVAGTDERFRVYFKTMGPGFFQLAWRPISSVERPAWTAASSRVTRHEWTVSLSTVSIRPLRSVAGISRSSITPWCAKQRNHFTVRWWDGGRWSNSDFEFNSKIQKSRSWTSTSSSLNKLHPASSQSLWRKPTLGTMNRVPDRFLSTLVCQATPKRPSSCMTNSEGLTWMASSKRSEANTMQRSHQTKILAWANSLGLTTIASMLQTAAIGMGTASFKVVAREETIWSWMAFSRWSSKSGRSIASLEATHLTEVLNAGTTEGPHSLWSKTKQYFKILSTVSGYSATEEAVAQCSNFSYARTWADIVLGAPERRTICLNRDSSEGDNSSLCSCWTSSLAAGPARWPMASRRAAHLAFSLFSWSSRGVKESLACVRPLSFLFGAFGPLSSARTPAACLSWSNGDPLVSGGLLSHNPKPSWKAVDSKNIFSALIASDQKFSSWPESFNNTWATAGSKDPAHSATLAENSAAELTPMADTNARLASGVLAIAWANASLNNGRDRILRVHLSTWAMITLLDEWRRHRVDPSKSRLCPTKEERKINSASYLNKIRRVWRQIKPMGNT